MKTQFGSRFLLTLHDALAGAGWERLPGNVWRHEETNVVASNPLGQSVEVRRPGRAGPTIVRSRLADPHKAALSVSQECVCIAREIAAEMLEVR